MDIRCGKEDLTWIIKTPALRDELPCKQDTEANLTELLKRERCFVWQKSFIQTFVL